MEIWIPVLSALLGLGLGAALSIWRDTVAYRRERSRHWEEVRASLLAKYLVLANKAERARVNESKAEPDEGGLVSYRASRDLVTKLYVTSEGFEIIASQSVKDTALALRTCLSTWVWEISGPESQPPKSDEFRDARNADYLVARDAFIAASRAELGMAT